MIELTKENYYDLNTLYDYMDKSTFLDFASVPGTVPVISFLSFSTKAPQSLFLAS